MTALPANYFDRSDSTKEYEEHLFIAGRGLQSSELNEIQKTSANRLRGIADSLFKDGDIIRDCSVIVDEASGAVRCASGAIYLRGAVRGVQPSAFTIPTTGVVSIGVRLIDSVVTAVEDPALRDPATGTRNYNETGAERLKTHSQWGWSGDGGAGEFFPVYSVTNAVLGAKEAPPNLDAVSQALARYDRDSAGGTYVVSGLNVKQMPDDTGDQVYSISEGRARVYGNGIELRTSRRVFLSATPDLKAITSEPQLSATTAAQRFDFDRAPGTNITSVTITAEKTVTLTHGVTTGAQDPLPDTSVLTILEVKQGATTYAATTDYLLTSSKVNWSPAGAEPAPGSTYTVKYQYITTVTPTAVDSGGFTVTGAVVGTLILASYSQMLPRIDRLCLDSDGDTVWLIGVASEFNPQSPSVPGDLLPLASVYQTWDANRSVVNDGVRVVPMPVLASIDGRFDLVMQLIAQQRLESDIHTREGGTKKGLFTDPFLDDTQRDAGTSQTAAIVLGELLLPISATIKQMTSDVTGPTSCSYSGVITLEQSLRTGNMKINPYMAFIPLPANIKLSPAVDRWTVVETNWSSAITRRFRIVGSGNQSSVSLAKRKALLSTSFSAIETLRPIAVNFSISGFAPGETLDSIMFDGIVVPISPTAPVASAGGIVTGSFTIPAGIPSGSKTVIARDVLFQRRGEATFSGQGTLERQTWQRETIVTETRWNSPPPPPPPTNPYVRVDPIAQTFSIQQNVQISAVDLWFTTAPTTMASVQIRETTAGIPNQTIVAEAHIAANSALVGGTHTRVQFGAPVLLLGGVEYAIVVLCLDADGALAVAELGKYDAVAQRWITSQPYTVGVLLSSSNASTWTAHQDRDLAFRLLSASYTETSHAVNLGNVAVTGVTDLLLMSYADRPASDTSVDYTLTLPDASVVTVSDGQPVQLAAAITGNVGVTANLHGTNDFSPILHPGSQLVAGVVATSGDYVSRAIPAGSAVTIKVIYEAVVPSGATVGVYYKGPDVGDTWIAITSPVTTPADDGFTEFKHTATGINELTVQIKLVLNGTTAARPRVRDLRVIVL